MNNRQLRWENRINSVRKRKSYTTTYQICPQCDKKFLCLQLDNMESPEYYLCDKCKFMKEMKTEKSKSVAIDEK